MPRGDNITPAIREPVAVNRGGYKRLELAYITLEGAFHLAQLGQPFGDNPAACVLVTVINGATLREPCVLECKVAEE